MATYSDRLRLELMTTGEFSGTWGDRTNVNMGTILEQAIAGLKTVTMTDADKTLTTATGNVTSQGGTDYSDDEARYAILSIESSEDLTSSRNVVIPAKQKIYIVKNGTTGSQQITVKTSAGTGIVIPNGKTMVIYCDGTNTQSAVDNFPSGTTIAGSEIATTTTGQTIQNKTIQSSTVDSTTVGATTASTGAFTTLTSSSTTTLNGTTIPSSKTLVDTDSTQTLTNKTLTSPYVNEILHEGTADDFETTLAFTDPTADRTITFPDSDGTVSLSDTTYTAGTGLTLDGTEFDLNVNATTQTTAAETVTSTTSRTYAVQVDSSDNLVVNVPWVDTDTQNTFTAGTGLELTGGEFSVNLGTATANTATQASVGTADGRTYLVQTDNDGDLVVNVPWENTEGTDTTYSSGTGLTLTGTTFNVNVEGTVSSATPETVTTSANRTYQVQHNSSDNLVVNIPWSDNDTTYSAATSTTLGLAKLGSDTEQATGANAVTSTSSRTYAVQFNASDQLVVNVPWSDTDENTEYTAGTGLTLTGTEFSADFDGSFTSLTNVPTVLANANNTSLTFEGSSEDDFETVLNISNPTADRTITFPDATGTVVLTTGSTFTGAVSGTSLTLSGDLTVNGTTTTLDSTNTVIQDNLLELNSGVTANANDSGIIIERGTTGNNAIMLWDESADRFAFGTTTATADSTGDITYSAANLTVGDVTAGALTVGNVTAGALTGTTLGLSGNLGIEAQYPVLEIIGTSAATIGPNIQLHHNSASPADNDQVGHISFYGEDSSSAKSEYAKMSVIATDVSATTKDSVFKLEVQRANTFKEILNLGGFVSYLYGTQWVFENETDSNASQIFLQRNDSLAATDGKALGQIKFTGKNSAGSGVNYIVLQGTSSDVTSGTEDGTFYIKGQKDGTLSSFAVFDSTSTTFYNTLYADSDFGLDGTSGVKVDSIKDEDTMSSNSATALATQQSIKAYVDANSTTISNNAGSAPFFAARAWGSFDGTDYVGSAVDLTNFTTGNVSSITRAGTGQYTINFSTAMPNSTYTFIGVVNGAINGQGREYQFFATSQTTSSVTVLCQREETEQNQDASVLSFLIFAG